MEEKSFVSLRKDYSQFVYEKFSWNVRGKSLAISFNFRIPPDISFSPLIIIKNIDPSRVKEIKKGIINNLVFNLGLMEMISYWKATCSSEILVKPGFLDKEQLRWWKDLIINGMGQFFFENRIDFQGKDFLKIKSLGKSFKRATLKLKERFLVPVGGGKDSIITLEFLKKAKKEVNCFALNPSLAAEKIIKISGGKELVIVQRKIDPKLLEMNRQGFLNGHTPFSAYLAFLSVLAAILFDYKFIAFSNEQSANEGNVWYFGQEINHQYSKTSRFEKKFRDYCQKYLVKGVDYFSFLRPLYELQIAKIFSQYPRYFKAFLSCNQALATKSGLKKPTGKWCGQCPKCLFVFTCLYPFIGEKELIDIFGQNLFAKRELLPAMKELIGESDFKPFECVGTKKESITAFYLSWKKARQIGEPKFLLAYFKDKISPRYFNLESESERILRSWNSKNYLPPELKKMLQAEI